MYPSDRQLIKQLRKVTRQLLAEVERPDHRAALGTMDAVINELMLRGDGGFYADYYRDGRALLDEALLRLGGKSQLPAELAPLLSNDAMATEILALTAAIESAVNALAADNGDDTRKLLDRIVDWELRLLSYRLRAAPVPDAPAHSGRAIDKTSFEDYLRRVKPEWRDLRVLHFHQVAGGFSKITILLETEDAMNGRQSLAIRAAQPIQLCNIEGSDIRNEFPLVSKAFANGVPVAEPLWMENDLSHFGTRFIVSRKVTGSNFGTATGATNKLPIETVRSLAETMASIHSIPMHRGESWIEDTHFARWLDMGTTRENTLGRVEEWRKQAREANIFPSPQIARAINWMAANVPDYDGPPVFLHGDYGPHNILLEGDRVSAVLDWEISTPGDPAYDVCWFLNCTAGAVEPQQFIEYYRAAGGAPISEYRLRYFEVFASVFMPITCNAALRLIEDKDETNINLALYGLRFAHEYASRLHGAIERAEAVKHLQ